MTSPAGSLVSTMRSIRVTRVTRAFAAVLAVAAAALPCGGAAMAMTVPAETSITVTPIADTAASTRIAIALTGEAQVRRAQVTLGDIAHVEAGDAATRASLEALPLGSAPLAGETAELTRATLARWIALRLGIAPADIVWRGAQASRISVAARTVTGELVARQASETLRAWLARDGARIDLNVAQTPHDLTVPVGTLELKPRRLSDTASDAALLARHMSVWVDVWVDGRFVRTVPVSFDVSVTAPAYVATEPLKAGQTLDGSAVEVRDVQWSGRSAPPMRPSDNDEAHTSMAALRLRRPLETGDVLTARTVETTPLVARGDWAMLSESHAGVRLESRAEVLEDGRLGDRVQVRLRHAKSAITARVTGAGTVEVLP
ncbi:flagellar basal body P-ring formation chaperone FlgA [Trinickia fusca]|uniref:Flagella basal body P-ring formation protein FlgA n=1 Tax=Trinickia fusca TaxID=2419777 RepID=A0A494XEV0_9BURK|nr:flagellar basal body P-ring formation chaperone FlgA [Trinickia fusca]RKP48412.1 flagella basal body P-ring formation protein FlgA [Trinickia fusca]